MVLPKANRLSRVSEVALATSTRARKLQYFCFIYVKKINRLKLATSYSPLKIPSPRRCLTSVFGMRTGVSTAPSHQIQTVNEKFLKLFL